MRALLRPLSAILLVAIIVATSLSLASARGKTHIAGQVVLCIGATVATVNVDANGDPVSPGHICPDCALMVLVDFEDDGSQPPSAPMDVSEVLSRTAKISQTSQDLPTPAARGPPVLI